MTAEASLGVQKASFTQDQAELTKSSGPLPKDISQRPGTVAPPRMDSVPGDYSKRVYQGVRVKHTVKDLLAEKRSRQTSNTRLNVSPD